MFAAPPVIESRVFARIPDARLLEGPSFDRAGDLYVVDIPSGRVFRVGPDGRPEKVAEYDGEPNGLKIRRDGRLFIADHKQGLLLLDPASGRVTVALDRPYAERFKGSTTSSSRGTATSTSRIRARATCATRRDGSTACARTAAWASAASASGCRCRAASDRTGWPWTSRGGSPSRIRAWARCGSSAARGEPAARIRACEGLRVTNVAYGRPGMRTLFMTEADSGAVLAAEVDVPGLPLYSHAD
jgi:gluconolactonase